MAWKYSYSKIIFIIIIIIFCRGREDKDKRRQNNGQTLNFFFKAALFGPFVKATHSPLLCMPWSFLLVHIQFTSSERSIDFVIDCFGELDHGGWSDFMVHGVNRPVV